MAYSSKKHITIYNNYSSSAYNMLAAWPYDMYNLNTYNMLPAWPSESALGFKIGKSSSITDGDSKSTSSLYSQSHLHVYFQFVD